MAGLRDELNTNYIQVSAADTVAAVYGMLGGQQAERSYRYVVWPADGAQFIVVRWNEIEQIGAANPQATLDSPIGALAGLPAPVAAIEIDSMGLRQARGRAMARTRELGLPRLEPPARQICRSCPSAGSSRRAERRRPHRRHSRSAISSPGAHRSCCP